MGTPLSFPKKAGRALPPNFWPMFIVAKRLDGSRCHLAQGMPQPRRFCVRWGPSPLHKKGRSPLPQFSANFYCGQMAGCIKMPLRMEVGLSPGDFMLDGDSPTPSPKGAEPPIFGPCLLRPNGYMDQDATWYGGRPRFTRHCVRWGPSSPPLKRHSRRPHNFWPMPVVAKRLDGLRCHLVWK